MMRHEPPSPNPDGRLGLHYFEPPQELANYFAPAYLFTATQPELVDFTRADFAQLRFMLAGEGEYIFSSGRAMRTPRVCLLGPTLGATHFNVTGPVHVIGVNVMPLGWLSLADADASVHADSLLDMEASGDSGYAELLQALHDIQHAEEAVARLWAFVGERMKPVSPAIRHFVMAVKNWLLEERILTIEGLMERTKLSARQISRLTNRLWGCSPKYLARKYRAIRCACWIGIHGEDWRDMVGDSFYDQSHLIRELKHFVGLTPHQIRAQPTLLSRLQLQRRDLDRTLAPFWV